MGLMPFVELSGKTMNVLEFQCKTESMLDIAPMDKTQSVAGDKPLNEKLEPLLFLQY